MEQNRPYHLSVMIQEVAEQLQLQQGGVYVDATGGGGGHSRALLQACKNIKLYIFDVDPDAHEGPLLALKKEYPDQVELIWGNYSTVSKALYKIGVKQVNGILADLGTSWHQLHHKDGFSFQYNTPLDMRMSKAHGETTAADIINRASRDELLYIFRLYGELSQSHKLVDTILLRRKSNKYVTTGEFVDTILSIYPYKKGTVHPATKPFQALRIAVNHELLHLERLLQQAPSLLKPKGRFVVISFHSLEDRLVKNSMAGVVAVMPMHKGVISPTEAEVSANPASRSARMRVFEKK